MAAQSARAGADQSLFVLHAATQPRLDGLVDHTALGQPPEEVSTQDSLGERHLPRSDREYDAVVSRGQFFRDLKSRVSSADDEDRSFWDFGRPPVLDAVSLIDLGCELRGDGWNERLLKRPGGDDNLVCADRLSIGLDDVSARLARTQPPNVGVETDR
jgi:hypothetical protein